MLSNMMVTELLFPFTFLLSLLSSSFGYGEMLVDVATIVPSISIGICSPLINGKSFAICCKASFLDGALVRLYGPEGSFLPYNVPVKNIYNNSLSLTCSNETIGDITISCSRTEFESFYLVNLSSFDQTLHLGDWSCETYIGSAKITVSSREVVTRNDGLVETQVNQPVQLLWNVTQDYVVMSPSNKILVNVSGNDPYSKSNHVEFVRNNATGKTGIKLKNTSGSDAGMYIFQASNGVKAALSLQVQEKPTQPKVIYRNLHIEGYPKVASAILYCLSESQSKGPMMYEQRIEYSWNGLNSQAGLHVGLYGSGVMVWNVDCTKVTSYPIFCNAEQYGLESETTWIIPQNLCLMSESGGYVYDYVTTPAPNIEVIIGVTVPSVLTVLIILCVYIWFYCIQRSTGFHGRGSCRYMFECSCYRQCCQATRNRFTAAFQAIRGCFHSSVTFIQHCHRRKREIYQNEENNSTLPDINFYGVAVPPWDQAGVVIQPAVGIEDVAIGGVLNQPAVGIEDVAIDSVLNQSAVVIEDVAIGGVLNQPAVGIEDVAIDGVLNQPAVGIGEGAIDGVLNQLADGIGEGATGVAAASASPIEAERRVQYQIEARSNLNSLHSMLIYPPQMLRVQRSQIVTDVLSLFEDSSTGMHLISTKFIDEEGADGGGVTRDMLTVFWNEVKERYFHGNEAFVPHLRPERLSEIKDFVTLGRIFSLSTATLKSIPIQMCRSTLMVIIYDTCEINSDTLLEDFFLFLDSDDTELLKSSLNSFDNMRNENVDKLQEFFIKFGMGIIPRAATLKQYVINLALNELCIKPKFFCENMRKGIPQNHMKHFWMQMTLEHLDHLYEDFLITAENIWPKIRCERWPLRNRNKRRVYGYLRDLLQDLSEETLLSFVQFVTGDRKIPSSFITVGFIDTRGIARCPIVHTCAYRLDIPMSYKNYEEFKTEFLMVLKSDEAKTFSRN